jgi:4-hydroxy-tetrahydrodipicolinate synthase
MKEMLQSFLDGNMAKAVQIHNHLMPLFKNMFITANPCPLKYALNYLGFHVGKPRLPLVEPDEKSAAVIREVLDNSVIDLPLP